MDQWEQVNAVQKMQDYIHQHLYEPITLSDLARRAGYSPFYSARLFKEHLGKAPFEYIRTLRLTRAALKLRDEKVKVSFLCPCRYGTSICFFKGEAFPRNEKVPV